MSTRTTNLGLIKPELTDAADITAFNTNWDKIDQQFSEQSEESPYYSQAIKLSGTSSSYTATVPGLTELTEGMALLVVPHLSNASSATLNVNGLGAKQIFMPTSSTDSRSISANMLSANRYYWLIYKATGWHMQNEGYAPVYSYGTSDLTAGQSTLETGKLYFVYE